MKIKVSEQAFVENYEKLAAQLLQDDNEGGVWFNGSEEEFEEWAGDVFFEALEKFLNLFGIEVDWDKICTDGIDIP